MVLQLIKSPCNTFGNASVGFVLGGTEFSDLKLSFMCPKAHPVSFDPPKHNGLMGHLAALARAAAAFCTLVFDMLEGLVWYGQYIIF